MRSALVSIPAAATAAAALFAGSAAAHADPFDRRRVPADAKWVAHADVDAARGTRLGKACVSGLNRYGDFAVKVEQVAALTGMHFPEDLHDATLYGREAGEQAVVAVAHARMDRTRMLAVVQIAADSTVRRVGGYDVVSWVDHGTRTFGAFHDDATVVLARSEANVTTALAVLDGTAPALAADAPMAGAAPPTTRPTLAAADHPVLYAAMADPSAFAKPGDEMPGPLRQMNGGSLAIGEVGPDLVLRVTVTAKTAEAAAQMRTAAEGLRAVVAFSAAGDRARPDLKQYAAFLNRTTFGQVDRAVTADVAVPVDTIRVTANEKQFALGLDVQATFRPATTRPSAGG